MDGTSIEERMLLILGFALAILLALAAVQAIRVSRQGPLSTDFTRLYGLVTIAALGATLVVADVDSDALTGAFTLLGTIAGYLVAPKESRKSPSVGLSPEDGA